MTRQVDATVATHDSTGSTDATATEAAAAVMSHAVMSQQHMDACCSMILIGLPFPPLPICALRGSDNAAGFMSSHDLLSRMIACANMDMDTTTATQSHNTQAKMDVITAYTCAIQRAHPADCYDVHAEYTRQYISLYTQTEKAPPADIRILRDPSFIAHNDKITTQCRAHFMSRLQALVDADEMTLDVFLRYMHGAKHANYRKLLELYAHEIASACG
jgi:hypothetical protein